MNKAAMTRTRLPFFKPIGLHDNHFTDASRHRREHPINAPSHIQQKKLGIKNFPELKNTFARSVARSFFDKPSPSSTGDKTDRRFAKGAEAVAQPTLHWLRPI
jgi:hypothetical protein